MVERVQHEQAALRSQRRGLLCAGNQFLAHDVIPRGKTRELVPANGTVVLNVNGRFTYIPAANLNGSDSFTYRVSDGVLSSVATVTLNIVPVNDAPSFVRGPDVQVLDESPALQINNWAAAISAGPAGESTPPGAQSVTFQVTMPAGDEALFAEQPSIDAQGTLRLTPRLGASGTTQVTVMLRDSGGTLGNGIDASASQTFVIAVNRQRPW